MILTPRKRTRSRMTNPMKKTLNFIRLLEPKMNGNINSHVVEDRTHIAGSGQRCSSLFSSTRRPRRSSVQDNQSPWISRLLLSKSTVCGQFGQSTHMVLTDAGDSDQGRCRLKSMLATSSLGNTTRPGIRGPSMCDVLGNSSRNSKLSGLTNRMMLELMEPNCSEDCLANLGCFHSQNQSTQ